MKEFIITTTVYTKTNAVLCRTPWLVAVKRATQPVVTLTIYPRYQVELTNSRWPEARYSVSWEPLGDRCIMSETHSRTLEITPGTCARTRTDDVPFVSGVLTVASLATLITTKDGD